ncbi:LuxR C-terminal-related transcriptional regulator [Paenibacillus dokdonensis]|uniref:LuxR C-terminal-related transcriptional regulator n=1 Tax=Paenibacillus dokdonensis TaxID=2567944 RepID=UPI0010A8DA09|nr:LuxR C-terminal-related transcriptional regulator [Paenibacillus dokdonensis]
MYHENHTIILSKLNIPVPILQTVPRDRLIAQMNEGLQRRATFITAPAGYGKTTLATAWARLLTVPVAWLSLDAKDNDAVRFWHYVSKAIEQALGGLSAASQSAAATLGPGHYETFLAALINDLNGLKKQLVLVFDDWHEILDNHILSSVSFFLEYLPPLVHICFVSRTRPQWAKARWSSRDWTNEFQIDHLRFDLSETMDFFQICTEREMPRDQVERIWDQTEGWVTGLRLAALSMRYREKEPDFYAKLSGESGKVEQYLLEEVFSALDDATRKFLMNVSILKKMNGPLCEVLSGETDSARKLAELADANLFLVPLDEQGDWYRLHPLFGDFLKKQQKRHVPSRTKDLYRAAALWYETQDFAEDAIDYYLAGQHYTEALRLLDQMRALMIRREFSTLRVWLSVIPKSLLQEHHYLFFTYIYSLLWDHKPDQAEKHLQLAEQYYASSSADWEPEDKQHYLGNLYYVRNFKATQYDMDVVKGLEYIRLSLQHNPSGTDLIFASTQMPLLPSIYRSYNGKRGRHLPRDLAEPFFLNMIDFMATMDLEEPVTVCYGELLYERNELDKAVQYLQVGLPERIRIAYQPEKVYVPACLFMSRISKVRQDYAQAEKWLEKARQYALEDHAEAALILLDAESAALRLNLGDSSAANEWLATYRVAPDDPVSVHQLFIYVFLVRILIESGQNNEAWSLSEKLLAVALKDHRPMDALDIQVLQALILRRMNKPEQAVLKLEEALQYAEPDEYIRVFVDKGNPVAEMLTEYVHLRQKGNIRDKRMPSLAYVRRILSCYGGGAASPLPAEIALETLLTKRELEIYRCMEEGLDNIAIAEALGIGIGTVKTHINHIYSKLQVTNRVEAIILGKEMQGP